MIMSVVVKVITEMMMIHETAWERYPDASTTKFHMFTMATSLTNNLCMDRGTRSFANYTAVNSLIHPIRGRRIKAITTYFTQSCCWMREKKSYHFSQQQMNCHYWCWMCPSITQGNGRRWRSLKKEGEKNEEISADTPMREKRDAHRCGVGVVLKWWAALIVCSGCWIHTHRRGGLMMRGRELLLSSVRTQCVDNTYFTLPCCHFRGHLCAERRLK